MKTRKEIYELLVAKEYQLWRHPLSHAQALRRGNIYAVKNTERVFQQQLTIERDRERVIELIRYGQNIHGISTLTNLECDEVIALLKGK